MKPDPEYHLQAMEDLIDTAQYHDEVAQALNDRKHYSQFRADAFMWREWAREQYWAAKEAGFVSAEETLEGLPSPSKFGEDLEKGQKSGKGNQVLSRTIEKIRKFFGVRND